MSRVSSGLGNFASARRPSARLTADFGRAPPSGEPAPRRNRKSAAVSVSEWIASAARMQGLQAYQRRKPSRADGQKRGARINAKTQRAKP